MPRRDPAARQAYMKDYRLRTGCDKTRYEEQKDHIKTVKKTRKLHLQEWFTALKKTLKCAVCPENFWMCIEFHHEDPTQKEMSLGDMARKGYGKERIEKEMAKCTVLCANCHRKEHARLVGEL